MKVEAYYPQRLLISLVVLLCIHGARACDGRSDGLQKRRRATTAKGAGCARRDQRVADVSEDYRINPGDVIDIQVDRAPELSGMRRVTASGTIRMAYLGPVTAHGKTADELAGFIADSLSGDT